MCVEGSRFLWVHLLSPFLAVWLVFLTRMSVAGVAAAAKSQQLRDLNRGDGVFIFSPRSCQLLTLWLLQKNKTKQNPRWPASPETTDSLALEPRVPTLILFSQQPTPALPWVGSLFGEILRFLPNKWRESHVIYEIICSMHLFMFSFINLWEGSLENCKVTMASTKLLNPHMT